MRSLIQEVVVDVDAQAGETICVIHWKGGVHTEMRLARRRRGQNATHTPPEIIGAVKTLAHVCTGEVIAGVLNRNGLRTGRGNRWAQERVTALPSHHKIPCYCEDRRDREGWMNLTQAARYLTISPKTLRMAAERGDIQAQHPLPDGPWIFKREALDTPAAATLALRARGNRSHPAIPATQNDLFDLSTT